jgi:segregation and condensation protein B
MNESYIRNVLEAALLAAGKPLQLAELGHLFEESTRPQADELHAALDALANEYSNRGVELKETAAGFRIQVRREFSAEISRLWPERPARYSRALLETLALVAYRQPITRAEIEAVRGVAVNPNIIKTLIERSWVRVVGHRDVPGRPELLGTTREFLDHFGLRSLDELPPLAEIKTMGDYNLQLELPNAGPPGAENSTEQALSGEEGISVAAVAIGEEVVAGSSDAAASEAVSSDSVGSEAAGAGPSGSGAAADGEVAMPIAEIAQEGEARDLSLDAAAEHTLSAGEVSRHTPAEGDELEAIQNAVSGGSAEGDAVDDSAEDDTDDDELSADGHGSRELVAAPPDLND